MPSRRYRYYGRLERPPIATDFEGGTPPNETVSPCLVDIEALTGFERVNAQQVHAGANYRARMRDPGVRVTSDMQLIVNDTSYEITSVVVVDREIEMMLVGPNEGGGR